MANENKRVRAVFAGFQEGDPTAEDVAKIFKALTGKDSTPEELAEITRILAEPPTP
jgi:hypothetical protein